MDDAGNLARLLLLVGVTLALIGGGLFAKSPEGVAIDSFGRLTTAGILKAVKWMTVTLAPIALFLSLFVATFDWGRLD